jgi:RNA recognition motif-containing protein
MNLYFSNLHFTVTTEELMQMLEPYGPIESINIIKDKKTKKSRGFAFVNFSDVKKAEQAMQNLNGKVIRERELKIKLADKQ